MSALALLVAYFQYHQGIVWIVALTFAMVTCVMKFGCLVGIDHFVMGLVVIAAGTSVPDALSSILVARDGFANMAVSNAVQALLLPRHFNFDVL